MTINWTDVVILALCCSAVAIGGVALAFIFMH